MKKINKYSIVTVLVVFFALGFGGSMTALAATSPSLGAASTFSVLGAAAMSTANPTTISGDLGLSPGLAVSKTGPWIVGGSEYFGPLSLAGTAQTDALTAFNNLAGQTSIGGWGVSPWSPLPGVYTAALDTTFTGTITLNGSYDDVWVFQVGRDMTFSGSVVLAGNAQACHVFFQVGRDATIASGSTFVGTLIASGNITFASGATVNGRIISLYGTFLAMNGTSSNVSGPTCTAAPAPASINVVKIVINDSGKSKAIADFPLFVNSTSVVSGATNIFSAPASYTVTENAGSDYTATFSLDCAPNGHIDLAPGDNKFCIITNNDVAAPSVASGYSGSGSSTPPLIDVVKIPSPLALPTGPGLVTYTYTLNNIGAVPVTNITMVGDTCSPIILDSGDTNGDTKLDLNETWVYRCSTTLSATHTNTVVATGWANGLSTTDIASATVIVGAPVVPPLIHVTKIPSPLALLAGGGMVTYTEKITNPGTVALSNVRLTDDKCSPMNYISGDTNNDSKLDTTETWTYTCKANLIKTTTNTATAIGEANGLTVRDFAIATVVVAAAVPKLPNTGFANVEKNISWNIIALVGIFAVVIFLYFARRKQTN